MKSLIIKIKTEKEKKYKNNDKFEILETELVKIKIPNKPGILESASKELNKLEVNVT